MSKNHFLKSIQNALKGSLSGLGIGIVFSYTLDTTFENYPTFFSFEEKKGLSTLFLWGSLLFSTFFSLGFPFFKKKSLPKRKFFLFDYTLLTHSKFLELVNSGLLENQLCLSLAYLENLKEKGDIKQASFLNAFCKKHSIHLLEDTSFALPYLSTFYEYPLLVDNKENFEGMTAFKWIELASFLATPPLKELGELLMVTVFRTGKEPLQGIGYLDDGSMVVINGGSSFLGEEIPVQVLSTKNTATGRIIFCNILTTSKYEKKPALKGVS